jgi:hypothetical protein
VFFCLTPVYGHITIYPAQGGLEVRNTNIEARPERSRMNAEQARGTGKAEGENDEEAERAEEEHD